MTDRPSRRRDLVPAPTADAGGEGDDTRRARRRSRRASPEAETAEAVLTSLPVPASGRTPPAVETPSTPQRASRRQRDDAPAEKIHLHSEPVDGDAAANTTAKPEKNDKSDPVLEKFRRETATYSDYAYRLVISRIILVVALLCFGWALWQAFQVAVTSYFRNLSALPYPDGSLSLAWAATEIASLAPLWMPNVS